MPDTRVICPECDATVRLGRDHPAGKRVRCPKCDALFRPRDPDDEVSAASTRRGSRRRDEDEYDDDRPRRSGARRQPQKSNAALVIGLVVAGVFLLGGGAVAVALLLPDKKQDPDPVVAQAPVQGPAGPKAVVTKATPKKAAPAPTGAVGLNVGDVAPEIDAEDLDGQRFKLSDYRGKVVVLDFWGHW